MPQKYVNLWQAIIGWVDGLGLHSREAIIWANDGLVYWRKNASLGQDELVDHVIQMHM